MHNNKELSPCQEKCVEQAFCPPGAGFAGGPQAGEKLYLTLSDKSSSTLKNTPVFSDCSSFNFDENDADYFKKSSLLLFKEFKDLFNNDKRALHHLVLIGYYRIRQINEDLVVVYENTNPRGSSSGAGWTIAQNTSNKDHARYSAVRNAQERALANKSVWKYFVTITFDPQKQNAFDFPTLQQRVTRFCQRRGIKYFLVGERHKSGAIHFHGLFSDEIGPFLSDFKDTAPKALKNPKIRAALKSGKDIKNCFDISSTFGYCWIEPIRDIDKSISYISKYILKTFDDPNFSRLSRKRFFMSKNLRHPRMITDKELNLAQYDLKFVSEHTFKFGLMRRPWYFEKLHLYHDFSVKDPTFKGSAPPFDINRTEESSA